jgi:hypothetical protein
MSYKLSQQNQQNLCGFDLDFIEEVELDLKDNVDYMTSEEKDQVSVKLCKCLQLLDPEYDAYGQMILTYTIPQKTYLKIKQDFCGSLDYNNSFTRLLANKNFDLRYIADAIDKTGQTPLILTCSRGKSHEQEVLKILQMGESCNPRQIDQYGYDALYLACTNGMKEAAFTLIKWGCKNRSVDGKSILSYAKENNMTRVVQLLENK